MLAAAEKFFSNHNALPTMPEVASRLLRSFDDDRISLGAIAELVSKDASLAAKVLREVAGGLEFGFEHFDDVADILAGVRAAGGSIIDMALGKPDMEQVFVGIMNQN